MELLIKRTGHWSHDADKYLKQLASRCGSCHLTARSNPWRRVSLSSLHLRYSDVICTLHFFPDGVRTFNAMDDATRHSAGVSCPDLTLAISIHALETVWISPFWGPSEVQCNGSFAHKKFTDYLEAHDIAFRLVPPRRHSNIVLESNTR